MILDHLLSKALDGRIRVALGCNSRNRDLALVVFPQTCVQMAFQLLRSPDILRRAFSTSSLSARRITRIASILVLCGIGTSRQRIPLSGSRRLLAGIRLIWRLADFLC